MSKATDAALAVKNAKDVLKAAKDAPDATFKQGLVTAEVLDNADNIGITTKDSGLILELKANDAKKLAEWIIDILA